MSCLAGFPVYRGFVCKHFGPKIISGLLREFQVFQFIISDQYYCHHIAALKTDQPPTTTLPSYHLPSYAFGAPVAVTKPSEEPPKAVAAFAFKPSTTSTGIPKFGQTAAPHAANAPSTAIPKFGEPSIPSAAISAGFQFGSALSANQPTTSTAGAPQFSTPTQQSTLLGGFSDTSKTTASALSNSPFVFKGTGDATDKLASTSATPKTGFAFGNTAPTGNGGFAFGSGATNTPKPSSGSIPGSFAFGAQTAVTQKSTGFAFGSSNQVRLYTLVYLFARIYSQSLDKTESRIAMLYIGDRTW